MARTLNAIPLSENTSVFLRGQGTWAAPSESGDVTGPASAVDDRLASFDGATGKLLKDSGATASSFAASEHNHDASYAALSHAHAAGDVTSGTMATARLGGGTADSSTFLRGDQTWATPSGPSGVSPLVVNLISDAGNATWTNMPAAAAFFMGSYRHVIKVDLTDYTEVRLVANKQTTAGAAAAVMNLKYAASFSTAVGSYADIGTSSVQFAINVTNTVLATAWVPLAAGAKADVFLAITGSGGDGVLDPAFGAISAQFR